MNEFVTEVINCPYCNKSSYDHWASENGFNAVKCKNCDFVYVNPRPDQALISEAVKTGNHREVANGHNVVAQREKKKIAQYEKIFTGVFSDVWKKSEPVTWLDIGAGYGEIVEAVTRLACDGSRIEGIEPMTPKANEAQRLGLSVREQYLSDVAEKYDFVSLVNVFSHVPDFRQFLCEIKTVIKDGGEFFMEAGNIADLPSSESVCDTLNLPDHLTFAGEKHYIGYLEEAGFEVVSIKRVRRDGILTCCKLIAKKILGRRVFIRLPYTSAYRALFIRARLVKR